MPENLAQFRSVAHQMADVARIATLRHFRTNLSIQSKTAEFDPVTRADTESEAAMREVLARHRPQDAILGEEDGVKSGTSGWTWILDPIDGTRGFIAGTPTWGVLIGLRNKDGIQYGIIDQPFTGERFEGGPDGAIWTRDGTSRPLGTNKITGLRDAILLTTFPEVGTRDQADAFRRVAGRCKLTRYGLDCYGYALLAAGHVDLVIEAGLQAYDIAAPIAVIEAAGGIVTDWAGGSAENGGTVLAAANRPLHNAALRMLGRA